MAKNHIIVHDKMQKNYRYDLQEAMGKNFDPDFKPMLTPKEMLALGVFGGKYMNDCSDEFPDDWLANAKLSPDGYDKNINFFKVRASQPLTEWQRKGWIHPDDPRGWFQWYCRYYMGRRHEDDARQIKRWQNIVRHKKALCRACPPLLDGVGVDLNCRPRQRQALLHWAYDSRKF